MFKQLPRGPANVNAWKNMCDPYIIEFNKQAVEKEQIVPFFWAPKTYI